MVDVQPQIRTMGTIIRAKCSCDYHTEELWFGAGMENFKKECFVPALRSNSKTIEMVNIKNKANREDYVFYNEPVLQSISDAPKIEFNPVEISTLGNLCPACGAYTLEFEETGLFD